LLVEDEQPLRDVIVRWLFEDGFDWREAADGRAAMNLLASGTRIDLVLSNMLLPVVDGFELLLEVKERYPHIPFAFVTAVNNAELRDDTMLKGATGYLLKPFSREQFLEFIREGGTLKTPISRQRITVTVTGCFSKTKCFFQRTVPTPVFLALDRMGLLLSELLAWWLGRCRRPLHRIA
jgi:CheY-like chemotaxis protein